MKKKIVVIIISLLIMSIIIDKYLEKSFDFSKYLSDQCPEGEIRVSWISHYSDGTIKVEKCAKSFSCPMGKKITPHCGLLGEYSSCSLRCFGKNDIIPDGF